MPHSDNNCNIPSGITYHTSYIFIFVLYFSIQKHASSRTALEAKELYCFLPHVFSLVIYRTQMSFQ